MAVGPDDGACAGCARASREEDLRMQGMMNGMMGGMMVWGLVGLLVVVLLVVVIVKLAARK